MFCLLVPSFGYFALNIYLHFALREDMCKSNYSIPASYLWWNLVTIQCICELEYSQLFVGSTMIWKHKATTVSYNVVFGFGPIKSLNSNHGQVWRYKYKYTQRVFSHPLQHTCQTSVPVNIYLQRGTQIIYNMVKFGLLHIKLQPHTLKTDAQIKGCKI